MRELVDFIIGSLVEKESYDIVIVEDEETVNIKVLVDSEKVSKLIGKSGRIAKAIRTIVKAISNNDHKKYSIYIEQRPTE